jgi:pimeloyl-ACP methyl ester carboxylesterase
LLHGQPGAGADWQLVISHLPATLRPMVLDRPGYRSSPHPAGDFAANAKVVLAEMDSAGITDAIVVGHSYGGGVAMALATSAPERVRALVLVSSIGPGCLNHWDTLLAAPIAGEFCSIWAWYLTPWFARARLARIARLRDRPLTDDEFVNWDVWAGATHEHGQMWRTFLTEQRALVRGLHDLVATIPAIAVPTLVMADRGDTLIPVETAYALSELLPHAELRIFGRGGHHLPRREAAAVAEAIATFALTLPG